MPVCKHNGTRSIKETLLTDTVQLLTRGRLTARNSTTTTHSFSSSTMVFRTDDESVNAAIQEAGALVECAFSNIIAMTSLRSVFEIGLLDVGEGKLRT